MALKLITAPTEEPVTLDEAKEHLRVDGTDDDNFILGVIIAARRYCEGFQNRAYITQTWDLWLDDWPGEDFIRVPKPPLQSVTSITYYDTADTAATMAATEYFVDDKSEPGRIGLKYSKTWPTPTLRPHNGIAVRFVCGYGTAADVPQEIKHAMFLLIGHWNEHREAVLTGAVSKEIEFAVKALLSLDRIWPV